MKRERQTVIDIANELTAAGLIHGLGGNISMRLRSDGFAITRSGAELASLSEEDVLLVDSSWVSDSSLAISSEWRMHREIFSRRPNTEYIVHVHPVEPVLAMAAGIDIVPFTLDQAVFARGIGYSQYFPSGSEELAREVAEAAIHHDIVVMQHHGACVVDDNTSSAILKVRYLQDAARSSLLAAQMGFLSKSIPADIQGTITSV